MYTNVPGNVNKKSIEIQRNKEKKISREKIKLKQNDLHN